MTRQAKTPQQRAQEQLGVADRLVKKLGKKAKELRGDLEVIDRELLAQRRRRDYLAQHPDLQRPSPKSTTSTPGGTTP